MSGWSIHVWVVGRHILGGRSTYSGRHIFSLHVRSRTFRKFRSTHSGRPHFGRLILVDTFWSKRSTPFSWWSTHSVPRTTALNIDGRLRPEAQSSESQGKRVKQNTHRYCGSSTEEKRQLLVDTFWFFHIAKTKFVSTHFRALTVRRHTFC